MEAPLSSKKEAALPTAKSALTLFIIMKILSRARVGQIEGVSIGIGHGRASTGPARDEATFLWESTKALQEEDDNSWQKFNELFLEKYLPSYVQDQLELRFPELKHENMSMAEYEVKFSELAKFVPQYVDTKAKKAKRFQQGLKS
ncbi:hypothetical protein AgCh_028724 [Apium graveolens]